MIWILFYYNSLPDFPKECEIIPSHIMFRDFFKCNPRNTDHYQYPKFETLSYDEGCHSKEVRRFVKKTDADKYVVFYTRHTYINGNSKNRVVGYFKVGKVDRFDGKVGFYSSDTVLLPKKDCIEINYRSRGVPVSWGNSSIKDELNKVVSYLIEIKDNPNLNIAMEYKQATKNIMEVLISSEGRKQVFLTCKSCRLNKICFLGKKFRRKGLDFLNDLYWEQKCSS